MPELKWDEVFEIRKRDGKIIVVNNNTGEKWCECNLSERAESIVDALNNHFRE